MLSLELFHELAGVGDSLGADSLLAQLLEVSLVPLAQQLLFLVEQSD